MTKDEQIRAMLGAAEKYHINREHDKALDMYDMVLTQDLDPVYKSHALYLLGTLYSEANKNGIARTFIEEAVKIKKTPEALNNLGIVYKAMNRYDKAKEAYAEALRINYTPLTLSNMSGLYINTAEPEKAYELASKAFALHPYPQSGNHMALASLEMQKWEEGFTKYKHRLDLPEFAKRSYPCPYWEGQKVKKLIVAGEQGLGDEVMFMSCFQFLKGLADEIAVECADRLVPLFTRSFGVKCYGTEKELSENFQGDAYIHMGCLPRIAKLWERWDERQIPYLKIGEPYPKNGFRIGFSWRGGTNKTHDVLRNFALEAWNPLMELKADRISIQYGPAEGMAQKFGLPHDSASIADIDKLCSMIASCDVIVTVCNTTCHLAGALNVPCYVLTPHKKAWRYATETERMRWYKSVVLIQQAPGESWDSVVARAKARICADFPGVQAAERAVA
jgi:tetratricopeptide (TPR) repeat protein